MSQPQATQLLHTLLQQSPSQVQNWLQSVRMGQQRAPEGFNWLGLADAAAFRARNQRDLPWAYVATTLYEQLANEAAPTNREGYIASAMQLRAYMITKVGPVAGDGVLDIQHILRWFFERRTFSYEEAVQKSAVWQTLNGQEKRELRFIKNRLAVILMLVKNGQFIPNQELSAWLSLRDKLP